MNLRLLLVWMLAFFSTAAFAGGSCEKTEETQKLLRSQKIEIKESDNGELTILYKKSRFEFPPVEEYRTIQVQSYSSILDNDIPTEKESNFGRSFDLKKENSMLFRDKKGNSAAIKFKSIRMGIYEDTSESCETSWNQKYTLFADLHLTDPKGNIIINPKLEFDCLQSHFYMDKNCARGED